MSRIDQGLGVAAVLLGSMVVWDLLGLARQAAVDCSAEIVSASGLAELSLGIQEDAAREAAVGFGSAQDKH